MNRSVKLIAALLVAALFSISAQALTFEATYNTGNAYMERPSGSYNVLADDILDHPASEGAQLFKYYGGQYNLCINIDTSVAKGTYLVGYLSSDGISYDEAIYVVIN